MVTIAAPYCQSRGRELVGDFSGMHLELGQRDEDFTQQLAGAPQRVQLARAFVAPQRLDQTGSS